MIDVDFVSNKSKIHAEDKLNYSKLAIEVVKRLRADLSQRQLSSCLGFSFNQVGKWESGATQIKWDDFINICETLNLPIESHFRKIFWTFEGEFDPSHTLNVFIENIKLNLQKKRKYQTKLRKWASKDVHLDLAEVFEIIDLAPSLLIAFLSPFIDCSKLPALNARFVQYSTQMELIFQDPLCAFVNEALQLNEYQSLAQHDDVILAYHSACSVEHLRRVLRLMTTYGIIFFDGKKYFPNSFDFSFSAVPDVKLRGLTKYTTDLASNRYSLEPLVKTNDEGALRNPSVSSVRVNALSKEAAKKVMDLVSEFHSKVGLVVQEDAGQNKNNVQVILIHSFASTVNSRSESKFVSKS